MISIVIPVLNEENNLSELRRRLLKASDSWGDTFEIVIVDDGSTDRTPAILRSFHEGDPRFKVVRLSRNFGHQVAISAGLEYASGDAVAVMDADLQDGPDELTHMLTKWREGYEVVYARPSAAQGEYPQAGRLLGVLPPSRMGLVGADSAGQRRLLGHGSSGRGRAQRHAGAEPLHTRP